MQRAQAEAIKILNESKPSKEILNLKALETFEKFQTVRQQKLSYRVKYKI